MKSLSGLTSACTSDRWKRKESTKDEPTRRFNGRYPPRRTTTTVYRRCRSMQLKASQVPTRVRVKDARTKDPSRKRKGQPTSPTLSATDVTRKATTRMNATPGSSVMTCKDPDTATKNASFVPPRVTKTPRSRTRPKSSRFGLYRAAERTI